MWWITERIKELERGERGIRRSANMGKHWRTELNVLRKKVNFSISIRMISEFKVKVMGLDGIEILSKVLINVTDKMEVRGGREDIEGGE